MVDVYSISASLAKIGWTTRRKSRKRKATPILSRLKKNWPVADKLRELIEDKPQKKKSEKTKAIKMPPKGKAKRKQNKVGNHVSGVIASINELLPVAFKPWEFFISSTSDQFNKETYDLATTIHNRCWIDPSPLFGKDNNFAEAFLRAAALYHDIGKLIADDHHVTRGVHLIRDVNEKHRRDIENLFDDLWEKRFFWTLLKHHDIFGCLCTGEASFPALIDMLGWTTEDESVEGDAHSALAKISYLLWLNIADSNATLIQHLEGITTVEARRYLSDWKELNGFLADAKGKPLSRNREEFKHWALVRSSHPDMAIKRITRLVATCYRVVIGPIDPDKESEIKALVADELQALHGPRFERFCYRFARFCKFDYALRFFYQLMRSAVKNINKPNQRELRYMVMMTCSILGRIVEEYGHLVEGDSGFGPRLGVDMSNLMRPDETGIAICESLKESSAGTLFWIIDEIAIWLYGE